MNKTLEHIAKKYKVKLRVQHVTQIPNIGRNNLPELFNELGFKVGAEIGTAQGEYAAQLCSNSPQIKLYCIDPWEMYSGFNEASYAPVINTYYEETKERLSPFNCEIIKKYSMDAVKDFPDESLDFVYIDGNHSLPYVVNDICEWSKKVRSGGIVAGHDYIRAKREFENTHHVIEAVDAYVRAYHIKPWFLIGLEAKIPGMIRDNSRSWMFVKE